MHELHLHPEVFDLIKNGSKNIEMRLNDEKRRNMKIGDIIRFTKRFTEPVETLDVKIKDRKEYNGEGMCHWGVKEQYYCEYSGDYCDCDCEYDDCCCDCCYWQDAHPTCELDRDEECPFYSMDSDEIEVKRDNNGSYIQACGDFDHCSRCRIWQEEHPEEEEEDEGDEE